MTNYNYRVNGLVLAVMLSTVLQLAGIAASLAFCWWLFARKGEKLASWLQRFLKRPGTLALSGIALCLVAAAPSFLRALPMLFMRHDGPDALANVVLPLNYSMAITTVIQTIAMAFLTVFLARKRLCARIA
jgi:hypothetical protein